VGVSWEAPSPGRHRQRGRLARWLESRLREARNSAAIRSGHGLVSFDVPPPVPVGARGMRADPRQVPATLMRPAMDAGQPSFAPGGLVPGASAGGDSVPALLDTGFIVPRYMAGRLGRASTGLGWPDADN
jgi:hypothetical protein